MVEKFYSKIVGVTHDNRQKYVSRLEPGDVLMVDREKDNRYDSNAIALYKDYNMLGYIKKEVAAQLAPIIDSGKSVSVTVSTVTGGGDYICGANIEIVISSKDDDCEDDDYGPWDTYYLDGGLRELGYTEEDEYEDYE